MADYYRHFKGGKYKLLGIARDSETLEKMVVYQALYGEGELWVRPYDMFLGLSRGMVRLCRVSLKYQRKRHYDISYRIHHCLRFVYSLCLPYVQESRKEHIQLPASYNRTLQNPRTG